MFSFVQAINKSTMHPSRYCTIFVLSFLCIGEVFSVDSNSSCGDWEAFQDEKCFKLVDDTTRTFEDAEKVCAKLESSPTLVMIHSKEEQDFVSNYLFNISKKVENIWLGAMVVNSKIKWLDNSEFGYTNWDKQGPRSKANYCVQMQADESVVGKWLDEPCIKKNLVVCQRMQSWTLTRLQKTVLESRKELKEGLEAANVACSKKVDDLKHSIIPIGFIYPQLPNSDPPSTIWSWMKWTDVSATYTGVFNATVYVWKRTG